MGNSTEKEIMMNAKYSKIPIMTIGGLMMAMLNISTTIAQTSFNQQSQNQISAVSNVTGNAGPLADLSARKNNKKINMPDWQWHKQGK